MICTVFIVFRNETLGIFVYKFTFNPRPLLTFLCGYDLCDYHTHILAFISEMRTVVLHKFLTVIFFKMSDSDALRNN